MKYLNNKLKIGRSRLLLLPMVLCLLAASKAGAQTITSNATQYADLMAVSIDPSSPSIAVGQTEQIVVTMKNNGPKPIPAGEATVQININSAYFEVLNPVHFVDPCGQWSILEVKSNSTQHTLLFRNNAGVIPVRGALCSFQFDIKGKKATISPVVITLKSSLSAKATTTDIIVTNQEVTTQINVVSVATPLILSDFSSMAKDCNAVLNWKIPLKNSIDSVEIEYSSNNGMFIKVGAVRVVANTFSYKYENDQGNGKGYYRLRIIEKGGKISYSKIVSADTKCVIKKGF